MGSVVGERGAGSGERQMGHLEGGGGTICCRRISWMLHQVSEHVPQTACEQGQLEVACVNARDVRDY